MSDPRDLRELLGAEASGEEVEWLRPVDELLRSAPPPPPEVPQTLTRAVLDGVAGRSSSRRRTAAGIALAAALAAASFGGGALLNRADVPDPGFVVPMRATEAARGAEAQIRVHGSDDSGNLTVELAVSGLPELPRGASYVLWLEKDGEYGATCGYFRTAEKGATVRMNAAYRIADYDAWVVTAHFPDDEDAPTPTLLRAEI